MFDLQTFRFTGSSMVVPVIEVRLPGFCVLMCVAVWTNKARQRSAAEIAVVHSSRRLQSFGEFGPECMTKCSKSGFRRRRSIKIARGQHPRAGPGSFLAGSLSIDQHDSTALLCGEPCCGESSNTTTNDQKIRHELFHFDCPIQYINSCRAPFPSCCPTRR